MSQNAAATLSPKHSVPNAAPSRAATAPLPLEEIEEAVRSIRYGVVQIIIQDGVVVQIDKTEKLRLR